ncbi:DUF952 domain-containing protein [Demequina sp. NBRC 110056]|uniref:DUF952 domain-containing protein n=1 Tax=Demequina sp. NBRC 110056 TaxID=1570345 RepID=UPI0009FEDAAC|nr:DUF952 domain-containing protein [Demequina sp. NBRC 110056]
MTEILHLAFRAQWADALAGAPYDVSGRGMTVADEGFVHCSTRAQLPGVLARHYEGVDRADLVILVLDTALIEADGVDVRFENTSGGSELFPHVFASLRPSWVTGTEAVPAA